MVRMGLVVTMFVMLVSVLCARLIYLDVIDGDFLQDQGDARTIRMERITAHRGMIRDRYGKPLAISSPVISLWADPGELPTSESDLAPLAKMLGVPLSGFSSKIEKARDREFIYLRRHLVPSKAREILEMKVPGVYGEREYHRYYPSGEVGAHVVGFTNIDDKGQEGLELSFDKWLAGVPGKV